MAKEDTDIRGLNIYQKLAAITGEIGKIEKTGKSSGFGESYMFIEYSHVAGRLRELFAKYGVVIIPNMAKSAEHERVEVTSKNGKTGVWVRADFTYDVINADKPDDRLQVPWSAEAIDYGDKATNKVATASLKYYLMRQFNISERGDDPDATTHEVDQTEPVATPPTTPPRPKFDSKAAIQEANEIMEAAGVSDGADKRHIILSIENLADMKELKVPDVKHVLDTLRAMEPAEVLALAPGNADIVAEFAQTVAHEEAEAEKPATWVLPDFERPSSGMATLEQQKLAKKWLDHYATEHPDLAKTFINMVTGKDTFGTFDEAQAVLTRLAKVLNAKEA